MFHKKTQNIVSLQKFKISLHPSLSRQALHLFPFRGRKVSCVLGPMTQMYTLFKQISSTPGQAKFCNWNQISVRKINFSGHILLTSRMFENADPTYRAPSVPSVNCTKPLSNQAPIVPSLQRDAFQRGMRRMVGGGMRSYLEMIVFFIIQL